MRISFSAKVYETKECKGIWLNTIRVQKNDGSIVELDRDTTEYSINKHDAEIEFLGLYVWDSNTSTANYNLQLEDFAGAKLLDWLVEDDTDENYRLEIIKKSIRFGQ